MDHMGNILYIMALHKIEIYIFFQATKVSSLFLDGICVWPEILLFMYYN